MLLLYPWYLLNVPSAILIRYIIHAIPFMCLLVQCLHKTWHRIWFCPLHSSGLIGSNACTSSCFSWCVCLSHFISSKIQKISQLIKHWHSIWFAVFAISINGTGRTIRICNFKIQIMNQFFVCSTKIQTQKISITIYVFVLKLTPHQMKSTSTKITDIYKSWCAQVVCYATLQSE